MIFVLSTWPKSSPMGGRGGGGVYLGRLSGFFTISVLIVYSSVIILFLEPYSLLYLISSSSIKHANTPPLITLEDLSYSCTILKSIDSFLLLANSSNFSDTTTTNWTLTESAKL